VAYHQAIWNKFLTSVTLLRYSSAILHNPCPPP
jgi:hypothetical protein